MTGLPAFHILEEFESDAAPAPKPLLGLKPRQVATSRLPDTVALRVQEAYAQGYADAEMSERTIAETRVAELTADFDMRLEDERSRLTGELADRLVGRLQDGLEQIQMRLASEIASTLLPILRRSLVESAILDLVDEVSRLLETPGSTLIDIWGDPRFIEVVHDGIQARLGAGEAPSIQQIRCHPTDASEITVALGDAVIRTRLSEWLSRIEEACGS
ncbi:MAG: hypothetical protein KDJ47_02495 [Hyphomicrobiaceae bacterium]|nr:hypothetical protein [Hyphomicrobiaceae bacterium]